MTGQKPSIYWLICWKYISPIAILGIFFSSMGGMFANTPQYEKYQYQYDNETHPSGQEYFSGDITDPTNLKGMEDWPIWAIVIAAMLILLSILWIPIIGGLR